PQGIQNQAALSLISQGDHNTLLASFPRPESLDYRPRPMMCKVQFYPHASALPVLPARIGQAEL
ncbi:MAG: hypothetical protein JW910_03095, partial [Anaerolineae bacterium]|nr:hypothetical protein [Anaerolineae bacterium]